MSDNHRSCEVAIIGAGTAGLSARAEVARHTDNYVVIDNGVLGTTCARVGCMPSKTLIEAANALSGPALRQQISGLRDQPVLPDASAIMDHVRRLRDQFAGGVRASMGSWESRLIRKKAHLTDPHTIDLGDETIRARSIIIATGSKPIIPEKWSSYADYLIDTDQFFELPELPPRMAVFGLGMVGVELAQALAKLGVAVVAVTLDKAVGGLTDPEIQEYAFDFFSRKMSLGLGSAEIIEEVENGLRVGCNDESWIVDKVLLSLGRAPVVRELGLENLGVSLDARGLPSFDPTTFQIEDLPVYIVGDANGARPLLHEASDEGRIAGYKAVTESTECFQRRTFLSIAFSSPHIAVVGRTYKELTEAGIDFVIGKAAYEKQGRALMTAQNAGRAHIYGDRRDGTILGAELMAPRGEHLAHLLAWLISLNQRAVDTLSLPFYHPTLEESLRKTFRELAEATEMDIPEMENLRCQETPV